VWRWCGKIGLAAAAPPTKALTDSLTVSRMMLAARGNNHLERAFEHLLGLHDQAYLVLFLIALNSFRNFGLRTMQYQLLTDEYGLTDEEAGVLLGIKAALSSIIGFVGAALTDVFGVRKVAIHSLSLALIGRGMLVVGRSRLSLYTAQLFFSPLGESLLNVGLYNVALRKLTTPDNRALAFSCSYSALNLSGGMGNLLLDRLKAQPDATVFGRVYTGPRLFLALTWLSILFALALVLSCLRDVTVSDAAHPEEEPAVLSQLLASADPSASPPSPQPDPWRTDASLGRPRSPVPVAAVAADKLRHPPPDSSECPSRPGWLARLGTRRRRALTNTVVRPTRLRSEDELTRLQALARHSGWAPALRSALHSAASDVCDLLRLRALWRAFGFAMSAFILGSQWTASENVVPPFLTRMYGEAVPVYSIVAINFWGCVLLPPLVGALTSHIETFTIALPGMWLMAAAPLCLVLSPTPLGAIGWSVLETCGEVLWSPRSQAWMATLAPTGREGVFLGLASARDHLTPILDVALGRLNAAFNPNCPECRDRHGHFCAVDLSVAAAAGVPRAAGNSSAAALAYGLACGTQHGLCEAPAAALGPGQAGGWLPGGCPSTCRQCPGWTIPGGGTHLWMALLAFSLAGPLLTVLLLPFLRGEGTFEDGFYGVLNIRERCLAGGSARSNPDQKSGERHQHVYARVVTSSTS
jgi:hypothetical protein